MLQMDTEDAAHIVSVEQGEWISVDNFAEMKAMLMQAAHHSKKSTQLADTTEQSN